MPQPLVAGNWKMNGNRALARELAQGICRGAEQLRGVDVLLCPSHVYLADVAAELADGSVVHLGAQDVNEHDQGAHTGEVAADMLADIGCSYVIVGHSERRQLYGETADRVAAKYVQVLRYGLTPILCVGETLEEREAERTEDVVRAQLDAVLQAAGASGLRQGVVAYEPVWAIGTGKTATPEQAQAVHRFIRDWLSNAAEEAAAVRLLYGGSVKPDNAEALFGQPDVDGGLIGGASLKVDSFLDICRAAAGEAAE